MNIWVKFNYRKVPRRHQGRRRIRARLGLCPAARRDQGAGEEATRGAEALRGTAPGPTILQRRWPRQRPRRRRPGRWQQATHMRLVSNGWVINHSYIYFFSHISQNSSLKLSVFWLYNNKNRLIRYYESRGKKFRNFPIIKA